LEPEYEMVPPCEIEISFNKETQFELHRIEVISSNKNLEIYRDEDCGGYLTTLRGSPSEVDAQQVFKYNWDSKSHQMVRSLKFKVSALYYSPFFFLQSYELMYNFRLFFFINLE